MKRDRCKLTKDLKFGVGGMGECRAASNKDGSHQGVKVIVAMHTPRMVHFSLGQGICNDKLKLFYHPPTSLGNKTEGRDTFVLGEVVALRHVDVAKVDFDVGVIPRIIHGLVVERLKILWIFGPQAHEGPTIDMGDLV